MALVRKAVNLSELKTVDFCGRPFTRSPLTRKEIEDAGFKSISLPNIILEEKWHKSVGKALKVGKALMVVSVPGTGKDVTGEKCAFDTNMPLASFSIKADLDINEWVSMTRLVGDGIGGTESIVEEGLLSKAVQGVKYTRNGVEYIQPCFILISDIDRATPRQLEVIRQALQSDGNAYLTCPVTAKPIAVNPDTIWYFTANSGVDGDGGRGNVTQEMDSSIANRMIAIHAEPPTEAFERKIIQAKFGDSLSKDQVKMLVVCVRAVRSAMEYNQTGLEISIRTAQSLASYVCSEMSFGESFEDALRESFDCVSGFFMDKANRALIQGAIDPKIGSTWGDQQSTTPTP